METAIHKHPHVAASQSIYQPALSDRNSFRLQVEYLLACAEALWEAFLSNKPGAGRLFSKYHPDCLGWSDERIFEAEKGWEDAQKTVANEHGYGSWVEIEGEMDHVFEGALDLLLGGELGKLEQLLAENPPLATARSPFACRATLLHHLAANGVPMHRQQVPLNAPDMLSLLLRHGADPHATFHVYGGDYNTAQLIATSAHPAEAGLAPALLDLLPPIA